MIWKIGQKIEYLDIDIKTTNNKNEKLFSKIEKSCLSHKKLISRKANQNDYEEQDKLLKKCVFKDEL